MTWGEPPRHSGLSLVRGAGAAVRGRSAGAAEWVAEVDTPTRSGMALMWCRQMSELAGALWDDAPTL